MLEELVVRNYALIDKLSVSFENGLNILTGETGAGKSIMVGAISFLLGARADADIIRSGTEETSVSAVIFLEGEGREIFKWLKEREIEAEENRIIIRRTLKIGGRGSIYIQDMPITRNELSELTALLFDIHGQHSHQSLLKKESHRAYLDIFAGLREETVAFNRIFLELAETRRTLENSLASERDRETRLELLRYAVEEIRAAAPKSGEGRELEAEAARLASYEKLASLVSGLTGAFFEDDACVLGLLRRVKNSLETAAGLDVSLEGLCRRIDDLFYEAEDAADGLRSYRDKLSYDPGRLEEVEERLALLFKLKKKYASQGQKPGQNDGEAAVLAYAEAAAAEIEALSSSEESREKLKADISTMERDMLRRAGIISEKRKSFALTLGDKIKTILKSLGMPSARFQVAVTPKGRSTGDGKAANPVVCGPWGADDVEFLISANTGEPLKELSRIASGGELSRVMLAIKTVLAGQDRGDNSISPSTLIFDEIDSGIGGEVALSVGEYLADIGKIKQIFCVTHLASIAVRADNHLMVEKSSEGGRTTTTVSVLSKEGKRAEIARMLAGDSGAAALAHAGELLAKYGK